MTSLIKILFLILIGSNVLAKSNIKFNIKAKNCEIKQIQSSLNTALSCMKKFDSLQPYAEKLKKYASKNSNKINFSCDDHSNALSEQTIYINNNYFYAGEVSNKKQNLDHVVYHEVLHFLEIPMAIYHRANEYDIVQKCLCSFGEHPNNCVKKFHDFATDLKDPIYACVNSCIPHESGSTGNAKTCENFASEIPKNPYTCKDLKEKILPHTQCVSEEWKKVECNE